MVEKLKRTVFKWNSPSLKPLYLAKKIFRFTFLDQQAGVAQKDTVRRTKTKTQKTPKNGNMPKTRKSAVSPKRIFFGNF